MRGTEQEKFMLKALEEARKAIAKEEVPVGCVSVKEGKILAKGHNLRESKQNSLGHAEIITINKACKKLKNFRLEECDMYVTLEPCLMCSGAIVQSRIRKVYFGAHDEKYGAVESVAKAFDIKSNHLVDYGSGILADECSEIIKEFFRKLRKRNKEESKKDV